MKSLTCYHGICSPATPACLTGRVGSSMHEADLYRLKADVWLEYL